MNKKSFILGLITGIVLTFAGLYIVGVVSQNQTDNDPVQYLEQPVSYEDKTTTSFKILQVLDGGALAKEASDKIGEDMMYLGNTVLLLGDDFYSDQKVTMNNPKRIGSYSYTNNGGMPMTVPVIEGEYK